MGALKCAARQHVLTLLCFLCFYKQGHLSRPQAPGAFLHSQALVLWYLLEGVVYHMGLSQEAKIRLGQGGRALMGLGLELPFLWLLQRSGPWVSLGSAATPQAPSTGSGTVQRLWLWGTRTTGASDSHSSLLSSASISAFLVCISPGILAMRTPTPPLYEPSPLTTDPLSRLGPAGECLLPVRRGHRQGSFSHTVHRKPQPPSSPASGLTHPSKNVTETRATSHQKALGKDGGLGA